MEELNKVENQEISVKEIILQVKDWYLFLVSKYRIILLTSVLGAALGVAYSYMKKPIYNATLTFALEDEKSNGLGGALGLAGQFGLDVGSGGGGVFAGANIMELFKSRNMVEQALLNPVQSKGKIISLGDMYIDDNNLRKGWKNDPKLAKLKFPVDSKRNGFTRQQDSILGNIYVNLLKSDLVVFQKDKKVSIITIEVKSKSEVFAKQFTESLVDVVSRFYAKTKSRKALLNMTILQMQLDSIRRELNNSLTGVAVSNDRTFSLNPALNVKRVPSARAQVDVQTNSATLGELVKQTELAKVTLRKETPLIQVIDKPIYPLKKEKTGKIKGFVFGGFLFGFLTVLFLVVNRIFKSLSL